MWLLTSLRQLDSPRIGDNTHVRFNIGYVLFLYVQSEEELKYEQDSCLFINCNCNITRVLIIVTITLRPVGRWLIRIVKHRRSITKHPCIGRNDTPACKL
jgi:hypothetical protein